MIVSTIVTTGIEGGFIMPTLDQKTVKALTLDGIKNRKGEAVRDWIFFDDDLHGFGVRVRYDLSGVLCKVWCVQYRHDGKQRRQNIGKFPRMNAATARTKAGAWLDKVHGGIDPAVVRGNDRKAEALKFHKAVDLYLARQQSEVRESTLANISLYLSGAYFRPLHGKPLAKITQSDIEQCLDAIPQKPTRWAAQKRLGSFYVWAVRKGHAPENPMAKIEQIKLKSRDRVLSESEIRTVCNALQDDDLGKIVKLLLLTGCRADEIGGLRFSELDLDAGTLSLPGERTKNGLPHTLTLPPLALDILRSVEKRDGRDFLFGKWAGGFTSWARQKQTLTSSLGLEHWTIHDLRRRAATHMAEIGIEPHVIEAVLNHVSGHKAGIAGIYNRASYKPQMKMALARWAAHLESIFSGAANKIVPLRA
ncbi:MAG TPA: tyrosine-type recombinase/integrase [Xanthobacteraceae bacterium]|nr:tyrosine-type recombinase/integrase [Xanthobacteraceae bacterium]